ncbi:HTH domain-containing protein, partial [Agathobacter rectalis]|uniref:HTH domain-containing protein n=3 Tax=Lachnospirales TaxID=3085636 RepID=UPI002ED5159B
QKDKVFVLMEVMCLRLRRIAKMAGVEENDIDRLLANPPEKIEIEVKYKIAVTVMELRFWLKDCESPI